MKFVSFKFRIKINKVSSAGNQISNIGKSNTASIPDNNHISSFLSGYKPDNLPNHNHNVFLLNERINHLERDIEVLKKTIQEKIK